MQSMALGRFSKQRPTKEKNQGRPSPPIWSAISRKNERKKNVRDKAKQEEKKARRFGNKLGS